MTEIRKKYAIFLDIDGTVTKPLYVPEDQYHICHPNWTVKTTSMELSPEAEHMSESKTQLSIESWCRTI